MPDDPDRKYTYPLDDTGEERHQPKDEGDQELERPPDLRPGRLTTARGRKAKGGPRPDREGGDRAP